MSKVVQSNLRCNEQIRLSPIRLIGAANEQIGVIETFAALTMAREQGLDLVEVAPNERPPVCRIMDYGKFKYAQKKGQKRQHEQLLKEVRLRPKTDSHDREIKINNCIKFLAKGHKVQFTMVFRGRERAHREVAHSVFRGVIEIIGELAKIERPPSMDGRNMIMLMVPNKPALDKYIAEGKMARHGKDEPTEDKHDEEHDHDEHEGSGGSAPARPSLKSSTPLGGASGNTPASS